MRVKYQATGTDLIPNKNIWFEIPSLIKVHARLCGHAYQHKHHSHGLTLCDWDAHIPIIAWLHGCVSVYTPL